MSDLQLGLLLLVTAFLAGAVVGHRYRNPLPIIRRLRRQRDDCADALRGIMKKLREDDGCPSDDPMFNFSFDADWEHLAIAADKALADVPTAAEQLRRIFGFLHEPDTDTH